MVEIPKLYTMDIAPTIQNCTQSNGHRGWGSHNYYTNNSKHVNKIDKSSGEWLSANDHTCLASLEFSQLLDLHYFQQLAQNICS